MVPAGNGQSVDAYADKLSRILREYVTGVQTPALRTRRLDLQPAFYPRPVTEASLTVEHTEAGSRSKTTVRYAELWDGETWRCRWDRHDNDHNDRDHFHYPPDPDSNEDPYACDADYRRSVLMVETPAEFVNRRAEDLFTTENPSYPAEYEWCNEYQPNRYECR